MSFITLCDGTRHTFGEDFTPSEHTIAFSLAHINRFNGHAGGYSVAQHCCLVSDMAPNHLKLDALLHDAPEAYLGDVTGPLKQLIKGYRELEDHYHRVIDEYYGVATRHDDIKEIDVRMLVTEGVQLSSGQPEDYPNRAPYDIKIEIWDAERAYQEWVSRFVTLFGGRV